MNCLRELILPPSKAHNKIELLESIMPNQYYISQAAHAMHLAHSLKKFLMKRLHRTQLYRRKLELITCPNDYNPSISKKAHNNSKIHSEMQHKNTNLLNAQFSDELRIKTIPFIGISSPKFEQSIRMNIKFGDASILYHKLIQ